MTLRVSVPAVVALALTAGAGAATPPPPLTVGAYYYAWYGSDGRHWSDGYLRGRLERPQAPALGEYDSRSPATIDAHYRWAAEYGVDLFLCSWWGPAEGYDDLTIRDHVLAAPDKHGTKLALLYESIDRLGPLVEDRLVFDEAMEQTLLADFDYLARAYFRDPAYYRIGGRPVVVLYVSRIYRGAYARAIRNLRAYMRAEHGLRLYLIGDEVDWDQGPVRKRIRLFDAITSYTMYSQTQPGGWPGSTGFLSAIRKRYDVFRRAAGKEGVAFVPNAQPAFNDRAYRPADNHYVLPHEVTGAFDGEFSLFDRFLRLAGSRVDRRLRLLTVTSWNEWHEDTQIEPTGAGEASSAPPGATHLYTYHAYGTRLLEMLARFRRAYAERGLAALRPG